MHIHTHIVCNAQDSNFKFKLKLGRVKLTQVLVPSSMLSRKKIKFSCESFFLYFKFFKCLIIWIVLNY